MALSDDFETTEEFLKELRGVWPFYCSSAEIFYGFVCGFSTARSMKADSYWEEFLDFVIGYSLPLSGAPWLVRVEAASPSVQCEVPLIYKLFDEQYDVRYQKAWSCETRAEWCEDFVAEHTRLKEPYDPRILPTPEKLVYVPGERGFWHLFYINKQYSRFYEVGFRSRENLLSWAEGCLRVPREWWAPEAPGTFR